MCLSKKDKRYVLKDKNVKMLSTSDNTRVQ